MPQGVGLKLHDVVESSHGSAWRSHLHRGPVAISQSQDIRLLKPNEVE